jgi:hypothetical protein
VTSKTQQEVEDLVQSNGGWKNVIPRFTTADSAASKLRETS